MSRPGGDTPPRGLYAPRTRAGWIERLRAEGEALVGEFFGTRRRPESYPYTEIDAPPGKADRTEIGACPICFNSCPAEYHVKDGRVTSITGVAADPVTRGRLCPKGQYQVQMFYNPDRLTTPQRRVGARGEGRFEALGWDRGLDEVAERLEAIRTRHGPEALAIFTGTRSSWMNKRGAAQLFAQLFGTPNHQGTDPMCASAASVAFTITQGFSPVLVQALATEDHRARGTGQLVGDLLSRSA